MKTHLLEIRSALNNCIKDKDLLMRQYIQDRLTKSFDSYSSELNSCLQFLTKKHEKSILKRINKNDKTN